MLLQDLYRVSSDDTWVIVATDSTVFSPDCIKYRGLMTDIPESLLDSHIKCLSSFPMSHILITIA